jgi:hypothetical protein|tara:strand:+ start:991 stop:1191 length:201 start_codon:yes stop_codon:yes gene_type:complete
MLIVRDIHDAITIEEKLQGMVRRTLARRDGALPEAFMSEMTFLLNDLGANIIRIEDEIKDYITDAI